MEQYLRSDIKEMDIKELNDLAGEVREIIIKKVSKTGGHMGPNLGFIEPTIAMHYVFNSPVDKIVYDVSHQCYTHKIFTGRNTYVQPVQRAGSERFTV